MNLLFILLTVLAVIILIDMFVSPLRKRLNVHQEKHNGLVREVKESFDNAKADVDNLAKAIGLDFVKVEDRGNPFSLARLLPRFPFLPEPKKQASILQRLDAIERALGIEVVTEDVPAHTHVLTVSREDAHKPVAKKPVAKKQIKKVSSKRK